MSSFLGWGKEGMALSYNVKLTQESFSNTFTQCLEIKEGTNNGLNKLIAFQSQSIRSLRCFTFLCILSEHQKAEVICGGLRSLCQL